MYFTYHDNHFRRLCFAFQGGSERLYEGGRGCVRGATHAGRLHKGAKGYDCGSEECTQVWGDVQEAWVGKNVWEICREASRGSWKCQSHICCMLQTGHKRGLFPKHRNIINFSYIKKYTRNLLSSITHFSEMCLRTNTCSELSMFSVKSLHKLSSLSLTLFWSDFF